MDCNTFQKLNPNLCDLYQAANSLDPISLKLRGIDGGKPFKVYSKGCGGCEMREEKNVFLLLNE